MNVSKSNIVLIGMPACGKSTIGVLLAKHLWRLFVDTDIVIQHLEQMPLQEIIDTKGLDYFRQAEQKHIMDLEIINAVIATGGSAVYSEKAMEKLSADGVVVFLDLPLDEIKQRLTNMTTRGVVIEKNQNIDRLFEQRLPLYKKFADITINCSQKNHQQTLQEITAALC